jgi:hypothetical protein
LHVLIKKKKNSAFGQNFGFCLNINNKNLQIYNSYFCQAAPTTCDPCLTVVPSPLRGEQSHACSNNVAVSLAAGPSSDSDMAHAGVL